MGGGAGIGAGRVGRHWVHQKIITDWSVSYAFSAGLSTPQIGVHEVGNAVALTADGGAQKLFTRDVYRQRDLP